MLVFRRESGAFIETKTRSSEFHSHTTTFFAQINRQLTNQLTNYLILFWLICKERESSAIRKSRDLIYGLIYDYGNHWKPLETAGKTQMAKRRKSKHNWADLQDICQLCSLNTAERVRWRLIRIE